MIESRLQELGLSLPSPSLALANYVPYLNIGSLVFISGQLPTHKEKVEYIGKVGHDFSAEDGQKAAHLCALPLGPAVEIEAIFEVKE